MITDFERTKEKDRRLSERQRQGRKKDDSFQREREQPDIMMRSFQRERGS